MAGALVAWSAGLMLLAAPGVASAAGGCPNEALRAGSSASLPDCRAYELVSPVKKDGGQVGATQPSTGELRPDYALAAPAGAGVLYGETTTTAGNAPIGSTETGIDFFSVSSRSAHGWSTHSALPPANGKQRFAADTPRSFLPSLDLSHSAFSLGGSFGPAPRRVNSGAYVAGELGAVAWLAQPLVSSPLPGETPVVVGGANDLGIVYFTFSGTLLPADEAPDLALGGASRKSLISEGDTIDYGLYGWTEGKGLSYVGVLPDGSVDPYGVVPAASGPPGVMQTREFSANQVSADGRRVFFMSPGPGSGAPASDPPELYVRETSLDGSQRTVLVSASAVSGLAATDSPLLVNHEHTYMYASPDGSHVFFEDVDRLTADAPNDGRVKVYDFNTLTSTLSYLPGVTSTSEAPFEEILPLVSAADGSRLLYESRTPSGPQLNLWSEGPGGGTVTHVAQFSSETRIGSIETAHAAGSVFVFQTEAAVLGGGFNSGNRVQVYRYAPVSGDLSCVSCPPAGVTPSGNATFSNDIFPTAVIRDDRGASADGSRVFFDTPDPLVAGDVNGVRDVYEWEQDGTGGCGSPAGCVRLISSGAGSEPSFMLDNDESGENVFFATTDSLVPEDTDGGFDVYDARVGGGFPQSPGGAGCVSDCQGPTGAPPVFGAPASAAFSGAGGLVPAAKPKASPRAKKKKKTKRPKARSKRRAKARKPARRRG